MHVCYVCFSIQANVEMTTLPGRRLDPSLVSFYSEVTVFANVAVVNVRCYLRTEPTNLSSSRRQVIDKTILGQIIPLFRVLFVCGVTPSVDIPLSTTDVSYY